MARPSSLRDAYSEKATRHWPRRQDSGLDFRAPQLKIYREVLLRREVMLLASSCHRIGRHLEIIRSGRLKQSKRLRSRSLHPAALSG